MGCSPSQTVLIPMHGCASRRSAPEQKMQGDPGVRGKSRSDMHSHALSVAWSCVQLLPVTRKNRINEMMIWVK